MSKCAYLGVGGKARKIKKLYLGVSNKAHAVKKAYIGIGGKARPWLSGEQNLISYGTIDGLSVARGWVAATSIGNYALFGGGAGTHNALGQWQGLDVVDVYNKELVKGVAPPLAEKRSGNAATSVGNYALFGGGWDQNTAVGFSTIDGYDEYLSKPTPPQLSNARSDVAATSVGNYALFGGGRMYVASTGKYEFYDTVDSYSHTLVRSNPVGLSVARYGVAATSIGNYALFGGGVDPNNYPYNYPSNVVDAYSGELVKFTPDTLKQARQDITATSIGEYAIFCGGGSISGNNIFPTNTIDAYNITLTRSTPVELSTARHSLASASVGDYALIGAGYGSETTNVEVYNAQLIKSTPTKLSEARYLSGAVAIGNFVLFGGGLSPNNQAPYSIVDAYMVSD